VGSREFELTRGETLLEVERGASALLSALRRAYSGPHVGEALTNTARAEFEPKPGRHVCWTRAGSGREDK
jgi:hypothetical protein